MIKEINPYLHSCSICLTRCDGKSKGVYNFENDVEFSEIVENEIIKILNNKYSNLFAFKTKRSGYPDIEIISKFSINKPVAFIEIKVQSRTFMSVEKLLPSSKLKPSETLTLNLSDLERYFTVFENEKIPTFILWCLKNRPCISDVKTNFYCHQKISILESIRKKDLLNERKFKRSSGQGDIINGVHKGVLVNYHFSINELVEGIPDLDIFN